jgi:hypothetical protein
MNLLQNLKTAISMKAKFQKILPALNSRIRGNDIRGLVQKALRSGLPILIYSVEPPEIALQYWFFPVCHTRARRAAQHLDYYRYLR